MSIRSELKRRRQIEGMQAGYLGEDPVCSELATRFVLRKEQLPELTMAEFLRTDVLAGIITKDDLRCYTDRDKEAERRFPFPGEEVSAEQVRLGSIKSRVEIMYPEFAGPTDVERKKIILVQAVAEEVITLEELRAWSRWILQDEESRGIEDGLKTEVEWLASIGVQAPGA